MPKRCRTRKLGMRLEGGDAEEQADGDDAGEEESA